MGDNLVSKVVHGSTSFRNINYKEDKYVILGKEHY